MNLNAKRRLLLVGCAAVVGAMLLYPPLQVRDLGRGYGWIFDIEPPLSINAGQLLIQWAAVAIIGGIAYLLLGDQPPHDTTSPSATLAPILSKEFGGSFVIPVLRVVRAVLAVIGWWQVIGIVTGVIALFGPGIFIPDLLGAWLARMSLKALVGAACFWLASIIKSLVNRLYQHWHGTPHPTLQRRWGL